MENNQLQFGKPENTELTHCILLKSYKAFKKYFNNCKTAKVISFCGSPEHIWETFDKFELERLEIIVGDQIDFREKLIGKPELADKLEKLKENGELNIYTRKKKSKPKIHCKVYILEMTNEDIIILHGSPNFSKNAWSSQHESVTEFKTTEESKAYQEFMKIWKEEKNEYCKLFMEDLTQKIESSNDQDREEIVKLWVQGKASSETDEITEVNEKIIKEVKEAENNDKKIKLSMTGFDNSTIEHLKNRHSTDKDTTINNNIFNSSLSSIAKGFNRDYGIPTLITTREKLIFNHMEKKIILNEKTPFDSDKIKKALNHIETYINSVDRFASSSGNSLLIKTHMFEVLLYFFWSPFINLYAEFFQEANMLSTKNLPFLYIYGNSNSGKSSYIEFLLNLISLRKVTKPANAADIGMGNIKKLRQSMTCFPFIIDDIQKNQINQYKKVLNSYWSVWNTDKYIPALIFSSNDNKPKKWFRNRAKMIDFNLQFEDTNLSQFESVQLMDTKNIIFKWFSQLHLNKINEDGIDIKKDDFLYLTRKIFKDLYSMANKELPTYFPKEPAEKEHDPGVINWKEHEKENQLFIKEDDNKIIVEFKDSMKFWQINELEADLGKEIHSEIRGDTIIIRNPDRFKEWYGSSTNSNLLSKIKNRIKKITK